MTKTEMTAEYRAYQYKYLVNNQAGDLTVGARKLLLTLFEVGGEVIGYIENGLNTVLKMTPEENAHLVDLVQRGYISKNNATNDISITIKPFVDYYENREGFTVENYR